MCGALLRQTWYCCDMAIIAALSSIFLLLRVSRFIYLILILAWRATQKTRSVGNTQNLRLQHFQNSITTYKQTNPPLANINLAGM